jgi:nitrate reductase beta subunit
MEYAWFNNVETKPEAVIPMNGRTRKMERRWKISRDGSFPDREAKSR